MYAASVEKKQIGKGMLFTLAGVVALVAVIILVGRGGKGNSSGVSINGETEEQRREYLTSLGYSLGDTSAIADVGVPTEFDERFEEYNEMLKKCGFDLSSLKGETVKKCTYTVLNRTDLALNVSAVLLVRDGEIIGGHLLDVQEGKLYPLFEAAGEEGEPSEETLLPVENEQTLADEDGEAVREEIPASAFPTE